MKYWNKTLISFVLILSLLVTLYLPGHNSVLASSAINTQSSSSSQITDEDFIKADGKKLKTKSGKEVILRGTNAGGYLLQEMWMTLTKSTDNVGCQLQIIDKLKERFPDNYQTLLDLYEDKYWTETDFDNCQELGMNVIRLPFWYKNFLDDNGNLKSNAFDRVDWFVEQAGKRGMYVILDMHGVPGSQNGQDHSGDTTQGVGFFQGDNASANQQVATDLWVKIAEHFKGNPTVAGYDLLNEPYTSSIIKLTTKTVWDYYDKAYKAIRQVDPDHLIIMEATWEPSRLPNPDSYNWTNIMYEYHCYNYDSQTVADDQLASINKKLNNIDKANYNVPSYIGETSFFSNMDSWKACLTRLNSYGISWTTWTYKTTNKNSSWGIFNQTTAEADVENDAYYTIYNKWLKADQCSKNEELYNILKEYFNDGNDIDETGQGRYEFEKADEYPNGGDVKVMTTDFDKFSKNSYVEAMNQNNSDNMDQAKYAKFNVNVSQTGRYRVMVGYATTTDTKFGVKANNDPWSFRTVSATYSWDNVWQAPVEIHLNKGDNTIKISGSVDDDSSWIILDYFDLTYLGTDETTATTSKETTTKKETTTATTTAATTSTTAPATTSVTTGTTAPATTSVTTGTTAPVTSTTQGTTETTQVGTSDKTTNGKNDVTTVADTTNNQQTIQPAKKNKKIVPGKVTIKKATKKKKKILLTYKKVKSAKGYQIKYATAKNMKKAKTIVTKKISYRIKNPKSNIRYVRVRAFTYFNRKKIYGSWSKKWKVK